MLIDGHTRNDNEDYETADEYAFVTTAQTFQEVEQIAAGEYWSDETLTDNSGYDTDGGPGDPPQRQHLPNPKYDFTYEPPVHPSQIPQVRFTNDMEGWTADIERPSLTYFSQYPRPPPPPVRALLPRSDSRSSEDSLFSTSSEENHSYANMSDISNIWSDSGSQSTTYTPMSIPYLGPDPPLLFDEPPGWATNLHILGDRSVSDTSTEDPDDPDSDTNSSSNSSSGSSTHAEPLPSYATTLTRRLPTRRQPISALLRREPRVERTYLGLRLPLRQQDPVDAPLEW